MKVKRLTNKTEDEYLLQLNELIATAIRYYRKRSGMTQAELARAVGVNQSMISRLERHDFTGYTIDILYQIFDVFDMDVRIGFFDREEMDGVDD